MRVEPNQEGPAEPRARCRERKQKVRPRWLFGVLGLTLLFGTWLRGMLATQPPPVPAPHAQPLAQRTHPGHEQTDANAKWIFGLVAGLLLLALAIQWVLAGLLSRLKQQPSTTDAWNPVPIPAQEARTNRSFPRLQVSPPLDLRAFQTREESELNTYGWVDRTAGVVRIPIRRAMDLVLQEGLPVRSSTNSSSGGPSSLGLIEQRRENREPAKH